MDILHAAARQDVGELGQCAIFVDWRSCNLVGDQCLCSIGCDVVWCEELDEEKEGEEGGVSQGWA